MFTGVYPTVHGATQMNRKFPEWNTTLAERLADNGVDTALFSASGFLTETYSMTRGFDTANFIRADTDRIFDDGIDPTEFLRENKEGWTYRDLLAETMEGPVFKNLSNLLYYKALKRWRLWKYETKNPHGRWDDKIASQAAEYIEEKADTSERFFAFVNLIEAHGPWKYDRDALEAIGVTPEDLGPPEQWEATADQSTEKWKFATGEIEFSETERQMMTYLYESWVHRVDRVAGRIVDSLDHFGIREDTLLVLTSDHGEIIAEENDLGHTTSVSEDVAHVPLVVDGPSIEPGRISDVVSLKDLYGAVLSRTGVADEGDGFLKEANRDTALIETRGPHKRIDTDRKGLAPNLWGLKRGLYTNDWWVERRYETDEVRGEADMIHQLDSIVESLEAARPDQIEDDVNPSNSPVSDRLEDLGYLE